MIGYSRSGDGLHANLIGDGQMSDHVNCYFFKPAFGTLYDGIELSLLPAADNKPQQMGILMGGTIGKRLIKGTRMFPVDFTKLPGVKGGKVYQATITKDDVTGQVNVVSRQSPDEAYVFIRTGLAPWNVKGEYMDLLAKAGGPERFQAQRHGFHPLRGSRAAKILGVEEADLGPDAEVMWGIAGWEPRFPIGAPPFTYALARFHANSVGLAQDIEQGTTHVVICEKNGYCHAKESLGHRDLFLELEEEANAAKKAAVTAA